MSDFYGYPTRRLSSAAVELDVLETAGPRIVRLKYKGSQNLLAEVPQITVATPYGDYHYLGGHRLWHAPESMPGSYIPDEEGLSARSLPDGVVLDGRTWPLTGLHKRLEIRLDPDRPKVTLSHTIINEGASPLELAPWALTMFRLGGTAVLPIRAAAQGPNDLLPDRHVSLWSYSRIDDPRLRLDDEFVLVEARANLAPFKIGAFDPVGWTAYWLDGILVRKSFDTTAGVPHPDFDCNAEIYCDEHFIELETLGPLSRLAPGADVSLEETWELYDSPEQQFLPAHIIERLRAGQARS